jgi:hypothetical protein
MAQALYPCMEQYTSRNGAGHGPGESFFATLGCELLDRRPIATRVLMRGIPMSHTEDER